MKYLVIILCIISIGCDNYYSQEIMTIERKEAYALAYEAVAIKLSKETLRLLDHGETIHPDSVNLHYENTTKLVGLLEAAKIIAPTSEEIALARVRFDSIYVFKF